MPEKTEAEKLKDRLVAAGIKVSMIAEGTSKPRTYSERYECWIKGWRFNWLYDNGVCSILQIAQKEGSVFLSDYDHAAEFMIARHEYEGKK